MICFFFFCIVVIAWLLFKYLVKPVKRAFLCSDLSLYHPPPVKKVFPTWLLFICAIVIPIIIVGGMSAYTQKHSSLFFHSDSSIRRYSMVLSPSKESCTSRLQNPNSEEYLRHIRMGWKSLHHNWYENLS